MDLLSNGHLVLIAWAKAKKPLRNIRKVPEMGSRGGKKES